MLARGDRLQLCTIIKVIKILFLCHSQAEFREISKFSFLSLNCHFKVKLEKNDSKGEFLDFHEFNLYMNFKI